VANVSTEGVRVNGNPPRADYGSNRPHYRTGARGRLAPGSWLLAKSPFSGIGKTSFREGFRGWFKAQEPDRARRGRFQYRCRQGSGSATCDMACSCHEIGTKVEFTLRRMGRIFSVSRPGGGLFGRPKTRKSSGRFLFVGIFAEALNYPLPATNNATLNRAKEPPPTRLHLHQIKTSTIRWNEVLFADRSRLRDRNSSA
jgi:hypothetical protein